MRIRAKLSVVVALALLQCERTRVPEPDPGGGAPSATSPRLVVLVVIDQLPSWSFDADRIALDGGIARLLAGGSYWARAEYPYATTHTAPGHATIGTGTTPSVHGIVANRWYDAAAGRRIEVDEDPKVSDFDPRGGQARAPGGVSNHRLRVSGIADALHLAHPTGRAVAIGWKSRAAVTVLGQRPDIALWFDNDASALTTSTAFAERLPAWVSTLAAATPKDWSTQTWSTLDPARVARTAGRPDDNPDEGDPWGLGRVFPHAAADSKSPVKALAFMPAANTLLVDAALAAIDGESLGADATPDVLAVTFSPHDFAGHAWCQESWERVDHLLRIDRELDRLFDALDAKVGVGQWAAVLTSDHGALPSRLRADGTSPPFFFNEDLARRAEEVAQGVLGPGDWVLGATVTELSMTAAFRQRTSAEQDRTKDAIVAGLRALGLAWVGRTDQVPSECRGDDIDAMVCKSVHHGHSGDVYFVAPQGALINDEHTECTAHGSPWDYDRQVPIVVMGPGYAVGTRTERPSMLSVAPTVIALLGAPPPDHARTPALSRTP